MSQYTDMANEHMEKCITTLKGELSKVRTGRANPRILDDIKVDYYGVPTPITQVAAVKVPEASTIVIEPWDRSILSAIDKAISASDLGITPTNDGTSIRLPFPKPTEERRKELVKECHEISEHTRVSIRNVRRDVNGKIERDKELSEDESRREQAQIQKITDSSIKSVDEILKAKEAEVMEI